MLNNTYLENKNFAIFGGSVDKFGRRYERTVNIEFYLGLDVQIEIKILD